MVLNSHAGSATSGRKQGFARRLDYKFQEQKELLFAACVRQTD